MAVAETPLPVSLFVIFVATAGLYFCPFSLYLYIKYLNMSLFKFQHFLACVMDLLVVNLNEIVAEFIYSCVD
jgi:hypothetical protein